CARSGNNYFDYW
nr:immunoglobulin heavy chain junction region [Mus musculus]